VELHHFEVPRRRPGPQTERQAATPRPARIGGVCVQRPRSTGGQDHGGRGQHQDLIGRRQLDADDRWRRRRRGSRRRRGGGASCGKHPAGERTLQHRDVSGSADGRDHRAGDLVARAVAVGVHDPVPRVGALEAQAQCPVLVPVEPRAQLDEVVDDGGCGGDDAPYGRLVAQPRARGQGVGGVELHRVVGADGGGEAALGPVAGAVDQVDHPLHGQAGAVGDGRIDGTVTSNCGPVQQRLADVLQRDPLHVRAQVAGADELDPGASAATLSAIEHSVISTTLLGLARSVT
jgi:hypothetical protein